MKARYFVIFFVVFLSLRVSAQPVKIIKSDGSHLLMSLTSGEVHVSPQTLYGVPFTQLAIDGFGSSSAVGQPCLPTLTSFVEVPICKGFDIIITHMDADTVALDAVAAVAPLQPSRSKSDTSQGYLVQDVAAYATDVFMGREPINVEAIGVARCQNLARIVFSPVRYNAVRRQLIVVRHIEVDIRYREPDAEGTTRMASLHRSGMYAGVPTVNSAYSYSRAKDNITTAPVRYLIVAHSSFRGQLDNFADWKRRKGFMTDIVYTGDAGVGTTASSIAAYVKGQYTGATASMPAPTFLLLVGDVEQIPAFDGQHATGFDSHVTDLYYATWNDGDLLPDCYYGRFSAQTLAQLTPQIEKTLMYEQYTFDDPSFLDKAIMVAGVDGGYQSDNGYTYGDPAMDYAISTYINGSTGFSSVIYYKNNISNRPSGNGVILRSNGGSSNQAQATELRSLYTEGAGWINYTAHGGTDEWSSPQFNVAQVSSMNNRQKFGFMIGNCCLSNSFQEQECFGESLLRRGDYCGAVAYFGGSNSTYWSEDFYWSVGIRSNISNAMNTTYDAANLGMYDRLMHTHGEPQSQHYTSAGAMMMAGNLAVEGSSSSLKEYYWEIYHLMGDPSVMPWVARPSAGVLSIGGSLVSGSTSLAVTAAPYAYVALTSGANHSLVAAAFADANGHATLRFPGITPGVYEVAATAQNRQPAFATVAATVPSGPYVVVTDVKAGGSHELPVGDTVRLDIELANLGTAPSGGVAVSLRTDAGQLLPLTLSAAAPQVAAGDTIVLAAAYPVYVWGGQSDGTVATIIAEASFGGGTRSDSYHNMSIAAPSVRRSGVSWSNTQAAPGDNLTATLSYRNSGSMPLTQAAVTVRSLCPLAQATCQQQLTIPAGGTATVPVAVTLGTVLPANILLPFQLAISNAQLSILDTFYCQVGESSTEDFETGDFNRFQWRQSTYPWQITGDNVFDGSFSARSYAFSSYGSRNKSSELTLQWTSVADDSISYWRRVSSEENYDEFTFTIDNTVMETLSGEVAWGRAAFAVTPGTHTFKFKYSKDYSNSDGSDCSWIDNVRLPASGVAYRFIADTVCQGEPYMFGGVDVAQGRAPGEYRFVDSSAANAVSWLTLVVSTPVTLSLTPRADTTINLGDAVVLRASGASRYVWNTGHSVPVMVLYPDRPVCQYSVTGYSGRCTDTRQVTVRVNGASEGLPDALAGDGIKVWPNPARDKITISGCQAPIESVSLYDIQGRRIRIVENAGEIDLRGISRGVYMVHILAGGESSVRKIVVY